MTSATSSLLLLALLMIISPSHSASTISENTATWGSGTATLPVLIASISVLAVLGVVVLAMCMDCYNSEVSSSTHPACGGPKGGGQSGYDPSDINEVNIQFDSTPSNAALPYSALPYQLPQNTGFCGYSSADAAQGQGQYVGQGQNEGHGQNRGQGRIGSHVNPEEGEEEAPPPSYGEAIRGYN